MKVILDNLQINKPPKDFGRNFELIVMVEVREEGAEEASVVYFPAPPMRKKDPSPWAPDLVLAVVEHAADIRITLIEDDSKLRDVLGIIERVAGAAWSAATLPAGAVVRFAAGAGRGWLEQVAADDVQNVWEFRVTPDRPGWPLLGNRNAVVEAKHADIVLALRYE